MLIFQWKLRRGMIEFLLWSMRMVSKRFTGYYRKLESNITKLDFNPQILVMRSTIGAILTNGCSNQIYFNNYNTSDSQKGGLWLFLTYGYSIHVVARSHWWYLHAKKKSSIYFVRNLLLPMPIEIYYYRCELLHVTWMDTKINSTFENWQDTHHEQELLLPPQIFSLLILAENIHSFTNNFHTNAYESLAHN